MPHKSQLRYLREQSVNLSQMREAFRVLDQRTAARNVIEDTAGQRRIAPQRTEPKFVELPIKREPAPMRIDPLIAAVMRHYPK